MRKVLEAIYFTLIFLIPFFLKINKTRFIFRVMFLNDFFIFIFEHLQTNNWCFIVTSGRRSFLHYEDFFKRSCVVSKAWLQLKST